jgi:hypothetical protein
MGNTTVRGTGANRTVRPYPTSCQKSATDKVSSGRWYGRVCIVPSARTELPTYNEWKYFLIREKMKAKDKTYSNFSDRPYMHIWPYQSPVRRTRLETKLELGVTLTTTGTGRFGRTVSPYRGRENSNWLRKLQRTWKCKWKIKNLENLKPIKSKKTLLP